MAPTPIAVYQLTPTWLEYLAGQDPAVGNGYLGQPNLSVVARKTGFTQVYVWRVAHGLSAPNPCFMASLVAACDTHEDDARHALFSLRRVREDHGAADADVCLLAERNRGPAVDRE